MTPPAVARAAADSLEAERIDRYGDPLPPGALMRLGTVRFRHGGLGIHDAAYSPDGKILATAGESGKIHLWEAATGKQIALLEGEKNTMLLSLAFSPDGKTLASGGMGFDLATRDFTRQPTKSTLRDVAMRARPLSILNDHDDAGNRHVFRGNSAFSPDGKWLAAAYDQWIPPLGGCYGEESAADTQLELSSVIALAFSPRWSHAGLERA